MKKVALALGSNLGDRLENLSRAIDLLQTSNIIHEMHLSTIYESPALLLEGSPQNWNKPFLNMVLSGVTDLDPENLLISIKSIEVQCGKTTSQKWAPRIVDIDILLYDNFIIDTPILTIPHSAMANRDFVLVPLNELMPNFVHPVYEKSINDLVSSLSHVSLSQTNYKIGILNHAMAS